MEKDPAKRQEVEKTQREREYMEEDPEKMSVQSNQLPMAQKSPLPLRLERRMQDVKSDIL